MMKWRKLGLIFCPDNNFEWMKSHASTPFVEPLGDKFFRVYFGSRDVQNRSSIGFFEFNLEKPNSITRLSETPLVTPGKVGLFDDSGISMGCVIKDGEKRYLYYIGWNLGQTVPWRNFIGLAISESDDLNFVKYSKAPIIERSDIDAFSLSYPWIIREGAIWRMWYGSNQNWGTNYSDMQHVIKYAESTDGINWWREDIICISLNSPDEYALARPCVLKMSNLYRMWYAHRGETYRIGYAESSDGLNWERKDSEVGIDVSPSGWDSQMIQYANVFEYGEELYMLYNGNEYGKTGIGLAVLER